MAYGLREDRKEVRGHMSLQKYIEALEKLAAEEVRIHKEVIKELSKESGGMKETIQDHIKDHAQVRHAFLKDLKKAAKQKK